MRETNRSLQPVSRLGLVAAAGLAGGLAEVLWVASYSALTGMDGAEVARQVTASVFPALAGASGAAWLGLGIHLGLSLLLAAGFVLAAARWLARRPPAVVFAASAAALAMVWAINFLLVLPALNPTFVSLLPYPVTLVSKLLFGAAMAWVLAGRAFPSPGPSPAIAGSHGPKRPHLRPSAP